MAVGSSGCHDPSCLDAVAATWFSTDGLTWSGGPIPASGNTYLTTVASDGVSWFAAGVSYEDDGESAPISRAVIWRSSDGRSWSLVASIRQGRCFAGCPSIGQLAARPGAAILSWVQAIDAERSGPYWSENGDDWVAAEGRSGFGRATYLYPSAATVVSSGRFVMVASPCVGCGTVWSSADGRDWRSDAVFGPSPADLDVATDGQRIVVVEQAGSEDHETVVWTSADGRSGWSRGSAALPIWSPRLTFAGGMFLAVGEMAPNGVGMFASPDGTSWTEIPNDLYLGDFGTCGIGALAGAADRLVAAPADEGCSGIWVSRTP